MQSIGIGEFVNEDLEENWWKNQLVTIAAIIFSPGSDQHVVKTYKITFLFLPPDGGNVCSQSNCQFMQLTSDTSHFSSCPWQCLQCLQWGQLPSLLARAARSLSAGPSFIPRPW